MNKTGKGGFMMRGGIEPELDIDPNHVNSDYWIKRLRNAMTIILAHPEMEKAWDKLAPEHAYVMVHALLAEKIAIGYGLEQVASFTSQEADLEPLSLPEIIDGVSSPEWFNAQKETPYE